MLELTATTGPAANTITVECGDNEHTATVDLVNSVLWDADKRGDAFTYYRNVMVPSFDYPREFNLQDVALIYAECILAK